MSQQYQEAKDQPLPFSQGHRPQVPKKPQTCAARNHEGVGKRLSTTGSCHKTSDNMLIPLQKEVKEGKRDAA
jgi:hypothetical protein